MKVRTPKSFSNGSATPKPSQEKAELAAAQSAGDEAASILESAEANILPFEPDPDKGTVRAENGPETASLVQNTAETAEITGETLRAENEPTEHPITSEAEPGKATVDAGEVVKFQSVADGYQPKGDPEKPKPAHVLMYERCLADATEQHLQAALYRQELQGQLKEAKDSEKAALDRVSKVIAGGPERYIERPQSTPKPENTAGGDAGSAQPQPSQPQGDTPPVANTSDAWRSAPITELSLPKKGSLNRLLKDGIETMGQFEDRRVAVAEGKGEWPKFFGPEKLTLVEEAFLNWLEANRDMWQVPQAAPAETAATPDIAQEPLTDTPDTAPAEPATEPASEPASELLASPESYPNTQTWESWTEKQQTKWIESRAAQIEAPDDLRKFERELAERTHWDKGFDQFQEGDGLQNCELAPGPEMDDWIRGWLQAEQHDEKGTLSGAGNGQGESEPADEGPDSEEQADEEQNGSQDEADEHDEPELATAAAPASTATPVPQLFDLDDL
jgi:hypothetical protein